MRRVQTVGAGGVRRWETIPDPDDMRKARVDGYYAGERDAFHRYQREWSEVHRSTTYSDAMTRADQDITGWREQREQRLGYYYPHPATSGDFLYQEAS